MAYIAVGALFGPHGLSLVADAELLRDVSEFGIIFLLFLIGLDMEPDNLRRRLKTLLLSGAGASLIFFLLGFLLMAAFGYPWQAAVVTGLAAVFSSTILGIKLLPTTVLHHRHVGEMVVGLLLFQDLIAILALVAVGAAVGNEDAALSNLLIAGASVPLLVALAVLCVRGALLPLIARFDVFHEFIFLMAIGWCLAIAWAGTLAGLSLELGAFIAGVALATSPISQYIATSLKPIRDFFLVLFFFTVGASLDPGLALELLLPTALLAGALIVTKPMAFSWLLRKLGETRADAREIGWRLGQNSEFSLLLAFLATEAGLIDDRAAHVIIGATILTLVLSSYLVVFRFPSPQALKAELRRD